MEVDGMAAIGTMVNGQLRLDAAEQTMYFTREKPEAADPGEGPAPDPQGDPEPAPAAAGGEIAMETCYVCVKYRVEGFEGDAAMLGARYDVTFHANGTADITIAGMTLNNMSYSREGSDLVVDYAGNPMRCTPTETGLDLDYFGTMTMVMVPEQ